MTEQSRSASFRQPLAHALDIELRRLERVIALGWAILGALGVPLALTIAFTTSSRLGFPMAICAAVLLALALGSLAWLRVRPVTKRTPILVIGIEGMLPWVTFAVLFFTQGAAYALASWVPPLVFAALVVAWVVRLQSRPPLIVSIVGAASYLAVYFVFVHPKVPYGPAHLILFDPPMQLSRAFSLVAAGVLGMLLARELRRAIARAEAQVRSEELFGKYRLVRKVGSGAGGSVHEAVYCPEGGFERRVAIKQLHDALASEPLLVDAFRAEAELGARLAHPNVVMIHDFGRHGGTFFMAMEFVDGLPLAKLAYRARRAGVAFSPAVIGHIARSVLRGLHHAHEGVRDASGKALHILHRDVCPQNLLVSRIGEVKVTDFGIARVLDRAEGASTRTIAGHEAYMAPEQIDGRPLGLTTDLFAVGVVLWELACGKRLFARDNVAATLLAVTTADVPRATSIRQGIDPAWDDFFASAMARDAIDRFPSAREMLEALDRIADAKGDDAAATLGELVVRFAVETAETPPPSLEAETLREERAAS
jgi:serine/threonine-protein kinase